MTLKSIKHNPYKIVRMFEEEVANYTAAPYAVAVDSCTNAIFLCCKYLKVKKVIIPKHTYLSVPQSILHAGGEVIFSDERWSGIYKLKPYPIYDSAKRFTSNMYSAGTFICLSFHVKKSLGLGKGSMILTDSYPAVGWFKQARYEGRHEVNYKDDDITMLGWNMYMSPENAARGLSLMQNYPEHVSDLDEPDGYRDLTELTVFKDCDVVS